MAACGSLQHIFEKPLPENPTLLESLSQWNQLKPVKHLEKSSFNEIFSELHFKENTHSSSSFSFPISSFSSPSLSAIDSNPQTETTQFSSNDTYASRYENEKTSSLILKNQYTSRHKNSGSLQLCTEGLGFESSDNVEGLKTEMNSGWQQQDKKVRIERHSMLVNVSRESRRSRSYGGAIPPPISCIGKSGRPGVCFQSYRQDGRFVLKEVRIPTKELLHASREDGRLKLQFIPQNDEVLDEAEYKECEEDNFTDDDQQEETEETASNYEDDDHNNDSNSRDEEKKQQEM